MKAIQNVLIAEESNVAQHVLAAEYIKAGYLIRSVTTMSELKNALFMNSFRLVLLGMGFGGQNTLELIKYVKSKNPAVMILLMASSLTISETIEYMKAGVSDCLIKPFDIRTLMKKTQQLFEADESEKRLNSSGQSDTPGSDPAYHLPYNPQMGERNKLVAEIENTVASIRDYRVNVLITGETGTGKALYSKRIHLGEATAREPFVPFNCESMPPQEMDAALFGGISDPGSPAESHKKGRVESVGKGTLYIQELEQMPLTLQARLSNVLQEHNYESGGMMMPFQGRIIATMSISPEQAIASGKMRQDLYYQLSEVRLDLPPLRLCKDRIPFLTHSMIQVLNRETGVPVPEINDDFWKALEPYDWPGNVREFANVIKYSFILAGGKEMNSSMLPFRIVQACVPQKKDETERETDYFDLRDYLRRQETEIILSTLEKFNGNRAKTAQYLRISERSLRYKLEEYNK